MKIAFFGTPDIAVPVLASLIESKHDIVLVVTQPDKPVGRKQVLTQSPIKVFAEEKGLKIIQPASCKDKTFLEEYKSYDIDLNVIIAYGQILPDELIYHPAKDSINIHASLLPKYRGASPINYAIINGESETGLTYQFIEKKLDAGDILHTESIYIDDNDDAITLYAKLKDLAASSVIKVVDMIESGNFHRIKQKDEDSTYVSVIKKEDGKLDFSTPSHKIRNKVRGMLPWPVAFCSFDNKMLKIFRCELSDDKSTVEPGIIIEIVKNEGFIVSTSDKNLLIKDVQHEGKKRMCAYDFSLGHPGLKGSILK